MSLLIAFGVIAFIILRYHAEEDKKRKQKRWKMKKGRVDDFSGY